MAQVITVAQQKGGAGKTTLASNLAAGFAAEGRRVAVLDCGSAGLARALVYRANGGAYGPWGARDGAVHRERLGRGVGGEEARPNP